MPPFSHEIKERIIQSQELKCGVCGSGVFPLEVHHMIPESLLGLSKPELGIAVCHMCHEDLDRWVFDDGITPLGPLTELPDEFFRGNKNPFKGIKIEYGQMRDRFLSIAHKREKQIKRGI
jgi:hypothetical protein